LPDIPIPLVWQSLIGAAVVLAALAGYLARFSGNRVWIAVAAAVLAADQLSKRAVERAALGPDGRPLLGGALRLVYLENVGLGFDSLFSDVLLAVACLVLLALILYARLTRLGYRMSPAMEAAGGLLVGSLLGVAVDRACLGYVVDFIVIGNGPFVYNLADLAGAAAGVLFAGRLVALVVRHRRMDVRVPASTGFAPPGPG
jgi:signal peptidase II